MRVLKSHEAIDEAEKLIVFSLVLVEPILFLNERISPLQQQLVDMVVEKAIDLLQAVLEDLLRRQQENCPLNLFLAPCVRLPGLHLDQESL